MKRATFLFGFLVLLSLVASGRAAILTVTTNGDTDDGTCNAHCSLREAIAAAQSRDTIIFDRSLRGTTIQLTRSLIIDKLILTIDGPNKRRITLRGSGDHRIVELYNSGITIDGFVITNGYYGGTNIVGGGGIYTQAQVSTISNCIITGNHSRTNGGGVAAVTNGGMTRFFNSSIINNKADGSEGGGGIYVRTLYTELFLYNTTIADNTALAPTATGGVLMRVNNIRWLNVTLTGNRGGAVGGFSAPSSEGGPETIIHSIVAGNIGPIPDMDAYYALPIASLLGVDSLGRYPDGLHGSIIGRPGAPADARLAPLGDYGGNIPTAMLLADSPARDKSDVPPGYPNTAEVPPWDARRHQRVVNSNLLDWGAVEYGAARADTSVTIKGRVTMANGRGVASTRLVLRDTATGEERRTQSNPFGYYQIPNVPVDKIYRLEAQSKRALQFATQTFTAEEEIEYADFISQ